MVDSTRDGRSSNIQTFDDAVAVWANSSYMLSFGGKSFRVMGNTMKQYTLEQTSVDRTPADMDSGSSEDKSAIATYTPLKYGSYNTQSQLFKVSSYCSLHYYNPSYGSCDTDSDLGHITISSESTQIVTPFPLFTSTSGNRGHDYDDCEGGALYDSHSSSCLDYSVLRSLCFKVSFDSATGAYQLDSSYGGVGCGDVAGWGPGSYTPMPVYQDADLPNYLNIPVTIRDVHDPLVQFYRIVGAGSTSFGLSMHTKFVLGLVFLSIFGCCCVCPLLVICVTCARANSGSSYKRQHDDQSVMYSQPVQTEHLAQPFNPPQPPAQQPFAPYVPQPPTYNDPYTKPEWGAPPPPPPEPA